jgi:hypothetical protein
MNNFLKIGLWLVLISCNGINVKPDLTLGFVKFFGGSTSSDVAEVQISQDGGYVFVGTTSNNSNGISDTWVVKTDSKGNQLWEYKSGLAGADSGVSIKQANDGGFVVLATVRMSSTSSSIYLVKYSNNGIKIWERTIGQRHWGGFLETTPDGGFIVLGNTDSTQTNLAQSFLYKIDASGNLQYLTDPQGFGDNSLNKINTIGDAIIPLNDTVFDWVANSSVSPILARSKKNGAATLFAYQKTQPFISENTIYKYNAIRATKDGGYILSGTCIQNNANKSFLMKISGDLTINPTKDWFNTYESSAQNVNFYVEVTTDNSYVMTGTTDKIGNGDNDVYIIKMDSQGNKIWQQTFGGVAADIGKSIKQTKDGGYIIAANYSLITNPTNNFVIALIKTDANGNIKNTP